MPLQKRKLLSKIGSQNSNEERTNILSTYTGLKNGHLKVSRVEQCIEVVMDKIGIIVTSGVLKRLITEIAAEAEDLVIGFGVLEQGVEVALDMIKQHNVKVIISTSLTAEKIRAVVHIPVIIAELSSFQLLQTLKYAFSISNNTYFLDVDNFNRSYDLNAINQILGFEVPTIFISSLSSAKSAIEEVKQQGAEVVVVTGNCMAHYDKSINISSIVVNIGHEELLVALKNARNILASKKKEMERNHWQSVLLDNSYDAIMLIDCKGIVQFCNHTFKESFGLSQKMIQDQSITTLVTCFPVLKLIYSNGTPVLGELIEYQGQKFAVNRSEVIIEGQSLGYIINIQQTVKIQEIENKVRKNLHRQRMIAKYNFDDIIGNNALMQKTIETAKCYSNSKFPILIHGESGTGKEIFCHSIHNVSPQKNGPFLGINCAALQETLLESELFGYEEGAFTGAKKGGKVGLFELVHGGTIFLDEISEMSLSLQSRLLRVLQEKEVIRVGGSHIIPIDVRIICATNKNLQTLVEKNEFRQDLFYRINTLMLELPPLRRRKEDIPSLVSAIFTNICHELGKTLFLIDSQLERLQDYDWPGNIRQLRSFMEKLALLANPAEQYVSQSIFDEVFNPLINAQHERDIVPIKTVKPFNYKQLQISIGTMNEMESEIITQMYSLLNEDKNLLSQKLGISKTTLWRRLKER